MSTSEKAKQAERKAALEHIKTLLDLHFNNAEETIEDGKFKMSFNVVFDRTFPDGRTGVKVTSKYSHTVSDEAESITASPQQLEFSNA